MSEGAYETKWTEIERFSRALGAYPAGYRGNRLNLLFVQDAFPITSAEQYWASVDSPTLREERAEFYAGGAHDWFFPTFHIESCPAPEDVSAALFDHFEDARVLLPTQSSIAHTVTRRVTAEKPDVVVLVVVDGLSYYDLNPGVQAIPHLVDGPTITEYGFGNCLGRPSLSQRLFATGYKSQIAFSFFSIKRNDIGKEIHRMFGDSQMHVVNSVEEIIAALEKANFVHGYVQVSAPGLDPHAHFYRGSPPIDHFVREILRRFRALLDYFGRRGLRTLGCMTSDHGLLWKTSLVDDWIVATDLMPEDKRHPRYVSGAVPRSYLKTISVGGRMYSLLKSPFLTRRLRRTEWGAHGGISAWESIVPVVFKTV